MSDEWQYTIITTRSESEMIAALNEAGRAGWEAIQITHTPESMTKPTDMNVLSVQLFAHWKAWLKCRFPADPIC